MPRRARTDSDAIFLLHLRHEFFGQEILVANLAIRRIDEKRMPAAGSKNDELPDLAATAHVFDQVPPAAVQQRLFVVAQPVEVIKHRIVPRLVRIETCRQKRTIANRPRKDRRLDGRTLRSALRLHDRPSANREQVNHDAGQNCGEDYGSLFRHSYFSVCTGSSRAARLAGYSPASRLTTMENAIAAPTSHGGIDPHRFCGQLVPMHINSCSEVDCLSDGQA